MKAHFNFTKEKLLNLKTECSRYYVQDTATPHLRLFVYPSGVKTYMLCRKVNNRPERIKIGRFTELSIEQARKEAARLNSLIAIGQDPAKQKRDYRNAVTFRELFNYYYEHHALLFTKCPKDNMRTMERTVYPMFGNIRACDMTSERVRSFHAKLSETSTKGNANRVIAIISAAFNFCIKNSYYNGDNPCSKVRKFKTSSRDRFLSRKELEDFFNAVRLEEELFEHYFLMLLYTGARKTNVLSMKWKDINIDLKQWRISADEAKNKDINTVYLSDEAIAILQTRMATNQRLPTPSAFVFPSTGRKGYLNDPKRAFERIRERMQIKNFRMHDLRRTLGSYMAIGGTSLPIIGKTLNHKSQVSTSIYARLSEEPVLNAINAAISNMKDKGHAVQFKQNMAALLKETDTLSFQMLC
jgi:integrase